MTTIYRDVKGNAVNGLEQSLADKPCSICGERADAFWMGFDQVSICRGCAVEVLPCLIADAVCHGPTRRDHLDLAIGQVEARFWRACLPATARTPRMVTFEQEQAELEARMRAAEREANEALHAENEAQFHVK